MCKYCSASDVNICLECVNDTRDINKNCICKEYYYQNNTDMVCPKCQYPCLLCTAPTVCETCIVTGNRKEPADWCGCLDNYFEDNNLVC